MDYTLYVYGFSSFNEKFCCTHITVPFIRHNLSKFLFITILLYSDILGSMKFEVCVGCHGNRQPFFIIEPIFVYVSIRFFHKIISILVNKSLRIRGDSTLRTSHTCTRFCLNPFNNISEKS